MKILSNSVLFLIALFATGQTFAGPSKLQVITTSPLLGARLICTVRNASDEVVGVNVSVHKYTVDGTVPADALAANLDPDEMNIAFADIGTMGYCRVAWTGQGDEVRMTGCIAGIGGPSDVMGCVDAW